MNHTRAADIFLVDRIPLEGLLFTRGSFLSSYCLLYEKISNGSWRREECIPYAYVLFPQLSPASAG